MRIHMLQLLFVKVYYFIIVAQIYIDKEYERRRE